jgi:hypothetical protein
MRWNLEQGFLERFKMVEWLKPTMKRLGRYVVLSTLVGVVLLVTAAEPRALESDWNDVNWRAISHDMRVYLCTREAPPVWCPDWNAWSQRNKAKPPNYKTDRQLESEAAEAVRKAEAERVRKLEAAKQPKRVISDQIWKAVVKRLATTAPSVQDYKTVTTRAFKDGDASALELLGYFHATGYGVETNYENAYEYYALAFLAGAKHVRINMTELWPSLIREAKGRINKKFNATGAGPTSK